MDLRTWTTLSRLIDQAVDLAPAERERWVEQLGPEYDALKPRLRAVLAESASGAGGGFLATMPKIDVTGFPDERETDARAGTPVGAYRLLRLLASGGQGSVWLAERTDGLVNRPVAIKLPHGLARPGLAERIARERDILATLTHPHIARLYDAGITAAGAPFLALEYIEGIAIDEYCARHRLGIGARLRLFLQVVRAVAYAHGQLAIHRDLKPSNVLVTAEGDVRLLDFGIARLLDAGPFADSELTAHVGGAMTLPYASPEQVSHAPLSVATDIYSIGVMLYELLCGTRPYSPARDTAGGWEHTILHEEPRRPSDVATDRAVGRQLRGDLDTIVLKALRKQPAGRYGTAAALADDIERYLDGRPVKARPDSGWYRARKFVTRHRAGVGAAAAVLVAIVAGAGVAVWQMIEAGRQRDAAVQSQRRAEAYSEFMKVLLQDTGSGGRRLTVTELLDRGTQILERQQNMDDSVAAYMRYEISRHYLMFNDTARELSLLQRSAEGARRIGDANLLAAAECAAAWALVNRDRTQAEAKLAQAEAALASVAHVSSFSRADCQLARSRMLQLRGDVAGAIAAVQEGMRLIDRGEVPTWSRRDLLNTQLAAIYRATERFQDALEISGRTLEQVRASGRTGSLAEITALNNHAANVIRLGEVSRGAALQQEAADILGRAHLETTGLGLRTNLGFTLVRLGEPQRAHELALADLALAERAANRSAIALSHFLAARALFTLDRIGESVERLAAAEALWTSDARMYQRELIEIAQLKVELLVRENRIADARQLIDRTLKGLGYPDRKTAPGLDRVLRLGSRVALLAADPAAAERFASDTLELSRRIARDEKRSADVGLAALARAHARSTQGRRSEAAEDAALAAAALRNGFGPDHADTVAAAALLDKLTRGGT